MERDPKSNSYIIKEAENIIENYLKNREEKFDNINYKEKYLRLKILSIALGITSVLGILFTIIFK